MREVVIKTFSKQKGDYSVRLGNGTEHRFKSEKAVKKFLAYTNRFLSEVAFQCNSILIRLYQHGREVYLNSPDFNHIQFRDSVDLLEHFIKQAYDRAGWKEGNLYVFIDLIKFCFNSKQLIKMLSNVSRVKSSDTIRRHTLDLMFSEVQSVFIKVNNYGEADCFTTFDTSSIENIADVVVSTKLRVA